MVWLEVKRGSRKWLCGESHARYGSRRRFQFVSGALLLTERRIGLLEAARHGPQNHQEVRVTHILTREVEGLVGRPTAVRQPGSSKPGGGGPKAGRPIIGVQPDLVVPMAQEPARKVH